MKIVDIGHLVQQRRQALGLSQNRLAKLGGLSRATINQLENGTLNDLGIAKLLALMSILGLTLEAADQQRQRHALNLVSQTASVSYKSALEPQALARALVDGSLPACIVPHVATLLDEAPLELIAAAVEEVATTNKCPAKTLWKHLFQWAHELQSPRAAWA